MRVLATSLLVLGLTLTGNTVSFAVDLAVVASSATEIKPGQILDGSRLLVLEEGESVALISESGRIIKLEGE